MRRIAGFFGGGSFLTFALGPAAVLVLALRSARPASASSVVLDFFTVRLNMKTRSKTFALKKHAPQITPRPLESCIAATGAALTPADMEAVAALVRRCLRLDPEERPTADVLLSDPIFHGLQ